MAEEKKGTTVGEILEALKKKTGRTYEIEKDEEQYRLVLIGEGRIPRTTITNWVPGRALRQYVQSEILERR
jgi:hypothetical protein